MTVFSLSLEKGGVGKTTSTQELSVEFAWAGTRNVWPLAKQVLKRAESSGDQNPEQVARRVAEALLRLKEQERAGLVKTPPARLILGIDADPQRNYTMAFGMQLPKGSEEPTIYDVMVESDYGVDYAVRQTESGVYLLRSELNLSEADETITLDRERRLRQALCEAVGYEGYEVTTQAIDRYAHILIDCPPNMGLMTKNAFAVSEYVLVPMQAHYFALEAMDHLQETIKMIKRKINRKLELGGIFLTQYDSRTKLSDTIQSRVRQQFGSLVFETIIPSNIDVAEAALVGLPIQQYNHQSSSAIAYHQLYREIAERFSL